jgi:hypothetical protein
MQTERGFREKLPNNLLRVQRPLVSYCGTLSSGQGNSKLPSGARKRLDNFERFEGRIYCPILVFRSQSKYRNPPKQSDKSVTIFTNTRLLRYVNGNSEATAKNRLIPFSRPTPGDSAKRVRSSAAAAQRQTGDDRQGRGHPNLQLL